jgi:hypothetical protein
MENKTKNLMFQISKHASPMLLVLAIASFGVLVVFKTEYWHEHLLLHFNDGFAWALGAIIPLIVEGMRFGLLLASTEDKRTKNTSSLVLGYIGSLGLFVYEIFFVCPTLGKYWSNSPIYTDMFIFMACMGMIVELRLIFLTKADVITQSNEQESHNNKNEENTTRVEETVVNKPKPFTLGNFQFGQNSSNNKA